MAAYAEGQLESAAAAAVADHVSRCDDCCEVTRETTLALAEMADDEPIGADTAPHRTDVRPFVRRNGAAHDCAPDDGASPSSHRRPVQSRRWLLPIAATLAISAGGLHLARERGLFLSPSERALHELVEAVGERRFFEPRLTGGFKYGPLVDVKRGPREGTPAPETWVVYGAVARARALAIRDFSVTNRRVLATGQLLLGDPAAAVEGLRALNFERPNDPALQADLSAALYVLGTHEKNPDYFVQALDWASRAANVATPTPEALFNQALACRALHLYARGIAAAQRLLYVDDAPAWHREAERLLMALEAERQRPTDQSSAQPGESDRSDVSGKLRHLNELLAAEGDPSTLADAAAVLARLTRDRAFGDLATLARDGDGRPLRAYGRAMRLYQARRYDDARVAFERVLVTWPTQVVGVLSQLHAGVVQHQSGDNVAARRHLQPALQAARRRGYALVIARAQWILGLIDFSEGRHSAAGRRYEDALRLFAGSADVENWAFMHNVAAELFDVLGLHREAWEHRLVCLSQAQRLADPRRRVNILSVAAELLRLRGLPYAAEELLREGLVLADAAKLRGTHSPVMIRSTLIALLAERRDPETTLRLSEALTALDRIEDQTLSDRTQGEFWRTICGAANAASYCGPERLEATIRWLEQRRREPLRAVPLYLARAERSTSDGTAGLERAIHLVEASQGARSQEFVAERFQLYTAASARELSHPDGARRALEWLRRGLAVESGRPWQRLEDLQWQRGTVQVYLAFLGSRLYVWLASPGTVAVRALDVPRSEIAASIVRLDVGLFDELDTALRALAKQIVDALPELGNAQTLVLVPTEELSLLPLDRALCDLGIPSDSPSRRVLVSVWGESTGAPEIPSNLRTASRVVIVGDVAPLPGFASLPATPLEVEAITALYSQPTALIGTAATVPAVRALTEAADVLHIAAHGVAPPLGVGSAALVLSGSTISESLWTASDIAAVRLPRLKVVVLTSCDSARSTDRRFHGQTSLATAFLKAGAHLVIASLTPVSDSTAPVMAVRMHDMLVSGGIGLPINDSLPGYVQAIVA